MARSEIDTKVEIVPWVCIYLSKWDRKQSNTSWNKQDLFYLSILCLPISNLSIPMLYISLSFLLFLHFSFLLANFYYLLSICQCCYLFIFYKLFIILFTYSYIHLDIFCISCLWIYLSIHLFLTINFSKYVTYYLPIYLFVYSCV